MFKKLILLAALLASSMTIAGEYLGARIIPLEAERVKIVNFEIDEDWQAPVVIVQYEIKKRRSTGNSSSNQDKLRKKVRFKIDTELLTDSQLDLVSEERGFFSSSKKQRRLAESLFTIKQTRGISGRVLLLELK